MIGQDLINAFENCNDDCEHCAAKVPSKNGKSSSCKEYLKEMQKYMNQKHKEFEKVLKTFGEKRNDKNNY